MKKSKLVYSLIGVFIGGGLMLTSANTAHAYSCPTNPGGQCTTIGNYSLFGYPYFDISYVGAINAYTVSNATSSAVLCSGNISFVNDGTIYFSLFNGGSCTTSADQLGVEYTFNSDLGSITFVWNGDSTATGAGTPTHFVSETIATSTNTILVNGYISPDDLASQVTYSLNISTPIYSFWDKDGFVATSSGYFSHTYQYVGSEASTTIEQFTFEGKLFTIGTTSNPFTTPAQVTILDSFSTTTFPGSAASYLTPVNINNGIASNCTPWSSFWSIGLCIQYLVYPSQPQITANITSIRDELLNKVPLGYITRIISILASSSTTPIPSISYTFQSDSPFSGTNISFDVGSELAQASTLTGEMTSDTDHKTAWQIFEPLINMFLAIIILFGIIHDVMGLNLIHHKR